MRSQGRIELSIFVFFFSQLTQFYLLINEMFWCCELSLVDYRLTNVHYQISKFWICEYHGIIFIKQVKQNYRVSSCIRKKTHQYSSCLRIMVVMNCYNVVWIILRNHTSKSSSDDIVFQVLSLNLHRCCSKWCKLFEV